MKNRFPRVVVAGNAGDSGKTLVSIGLLSFWRRQGLKIAGFKKGPDFIDAAWLTEAAQTKTHNLDVYLMGKSAVFNSFVTHAFRKDICLIEGNRGLYDGMDPKGTYSSAELAKLLSAPVVLVLDATKVTRTLAAFVLGCLKLDPDVQIAGVIINKIAGTRHERIIRETIEKITGIPVLGAIPKLSRTDLLPERHLGLVTPEEHGKIKHSCFELGRIVEKYVDTDKIYELANKSNKLESPPEPIRTRNNTDTRLTVGYFYDSAFTFYYPENIEELEKSGAKLVKISPLKDSFLPEMDVLYIGGGFPETHAEILSKNRSLLQEVKNAADQGLPIYAECGGLIFLSESLRCGNEVYPMSAVLPIKVELRSKPAGHGYCEFEVDRINPFFPVGIRIRAHEFHYTTIIAGLDKISTVYNVLRGQGYLDKREGIVYKNVLAGYFHLHALSVPLWADVILNAAKKFKEAKENKAVLV